MEKYKLQSGEDSDKIFVITRSEIEGRIEAEYYKPSIRLLEYKIRKKASKKLKDFALKMASGATPSVTEEDKYYSVKENGIPFLRVQNLQTNGELSLDDVKHINKATHQTMLKRSQVSEHDLLIKITGVGRMAVASVAPDEFMGNTNQHMVVMKTASEDISRYLAKYLNLDIVEKLASRRSTGATRPALDYAALKSIPIIEDINFDSLAESIKRRDNRLKEANLILNEIESYLLSELKIAKTNKVGIDKIFNLNVGELFNQRIDPDYYKNEYKIIKKAIAASPHPKVPLKSALKFISNGKTPSSSAYSDEPNENPIIKVGSYTGDYIDLAKCDYSIKPQKFSVDKGDIFILSAAHQSEYIGRHIKYLNKVPDLKTSFVGELICLRVNEQCNSLYLFSLLNLEYFKTLINREKTGQTSHVYPKDIATIDIVLPHISVQNSIVGNIKTIREKAEKLITEAAEIIANAKVLIEKQVLKN